MTAMVQLLFLLVTDLGIFHIKCRIQVMESLRLLPIFQRKAWEPGRVSQGRILFRKPCIAVCEGMSEARDVDCRMLEML